MTLQSDEARKRWREILDHAENGGEVRILRYNRLAVVMTSPARIRPADTGIGDEGQEARS
jgi:hypothetical protein